MALHLLQVREHQPFIAFKFLWVQHGLWLFVVDGMLLLPKQMAPFGQRGWFYLHWGCLYWHKLALRTEGYEEAGGNLTFIGRTHIAPVAWCFPAASLAEQLL